VTTSPNPDQPDTEGRTLPPYEGRRRSADIGGPEESTKDGARTAGATGPVEDPEPKADEPADTPRGEHASPADEQPASDSTDTDLDPDSTGPAHVAGNPRGEDQS
jgi:hypothetical protein